MRLAEAKSRPFDDDAAAESISSVSLALLIEAVPPRQSSRVAASFRRAGVILNDRSLKFIPFFATLSRLLYYLKSTTTMTAATCVRAYVRT